MLQHKCRSSRMSSIINDNWLSPAVQFLLTGYDVQQETAWRDSQVRTWRQEDVRWMADERLAAASEELATKYVHSILSYEIRDKITLASACKSDTGARTPVTKPTTTTLPTAGSRTRLAPRQRSPSSSSSSRASHSCRPCWRALLRCRLRSSTTTRRRCQTQSTGCMRSRQPLR